jgi:hypothetical protein
VEQRGELSALRLERFDMHTVLRIFLFTCAVAAPFFATPQGPTVSTQDGAVSSTLTNFRGVMAQPFQGGFECVAPPRSRTPLATSGGNPGGNDGSGSYSTDFNARIRSGVEPALVAGVVVDARYWMLDGAASFQTGLSNAVEFTIVP